MRKIIIVFIILSMMFLYHDKIFRYMCNGIVSYVPIVDSYLRKNFFDDRFWLHRVNSIDKFNEFSNYYDGFEMDVVYIEELGILENSHDKSDFKNYDLEMQFKNMFEKGDNKKKIWLDIKNINEVNKYDICNKILYLCNKYNISNKNIIIETSKYESTDVFKKAGFYTSYYFPYIDLSEVDKNDIQFITSKVEKIIKNSSVDYISFDYRYYDILRNIEMPMGKNFLCWDGDNSWLYFRFSNKTRDIFNDSRVHIILVKEKSEYSR